MDATDDGNNDDSDGDDNDNSDVGWRKMVYD